MAYLRSVGLFTSCVILLLYTLNNVAMVYSNFWLSYWSNDAAEANGTIPASQRDMRLGVYGALGLVQGRTYSVAHCSCMCKHINTYRIRFTKHTVYLV